MPRARRFIETSKVYELVFRAKSGIPLPCTPYMNALILGCIARTQRDSKVILCGYVVMGNHLHIIVVCHRDEEAITKFHMELKKKLTETIKVLLDEPHLLLWDGKTTVMQILDPDKALERIAYCYANPANAHLVDTIEEYPGLSSWNEFRASCNDVNASHQHKIKWYRYATIKPLNDLTPQQYLTLLRAFDTVEHELVIEPNAWMRSFDITESHEVEEINKRIIAQVREQEHSARRHRIENNNSVWSRNNLTKQKPTIRGHTPKKRERKIFFLGSTDEVRVSFYKAYKQFLDTCTLLYTQWRKGDFSVEWPACAFIPWRPPIIAT